MGFSARVLRSILFALSLLNFIVGIIIFLYGLFKYAGENGIIVGLVESINDLNN
jgi:hypothetical protein